MFTEPELADLRKRINATKWPEREAVADHKACNFNDAETPRYWGPTTTRNRARLTKALSH